MTEADHQKRNIFMALAVLVAFALAAVVLWLWTLKPTISMTTDALGSTRGGRQFVISGTNFILPGQTRVLVGGIDATKVTVQSPGTILATAPAGSDGLVSVTVISPNGHRATLAEGYQYSAIKPEVDSVTPKVWPAQGGVIVTVRGYGFTKSPVLVRVHEEIVAARVVDDTTLTFLAPKSPGPVPMSVNLDVSTPDDVWASDEFGINYR